MQTRMEDVIPVSRLIRSTMPAARAFFVHDRSLISARNPRVPSSPVAKSSSFRRAGCRKHFFTVPTCSRTKSSDVTAHLADVGLLLRDINYSYPYNMSCLFRMRHRIELRGLEIIFLIAAHARVNKIYRQL